MMRFAREYGLGIALGAAFLISWLAQWWTHSGTFSDFMNATFENWQSEFLQLLTFVVLSKYLIYRDSPQSRDGSDNVLGHIKELKRIQLEVLRRINRTETD